MTSFGILMPALRPPKTIEAGDKRIMQIRARRSRDLDVCRALYMQGLLGPTMHTPDMDYEYRAYCEPDDFAEAAAQMIRDIGYTKFKPTVIEDHADHELHDAYNQIWGVVLRELASPERRAFHSGWERPSDPLDPAFFDPTDPAWSNQQTYEWPRVRQPVREPAELPIVGEVLPRHSPDPERDAEFLLWWNEVDELRRAQREPLRHDGCQHPTDGFSQKGCELLTRTTRASRIEELMERITTYDLLHGQPNR